MVMIELCKYFKFPSTVFLTHKKLADIDPVIIPIESNKFLVHCHLTASLVYLQGYKPPIFREQGLDLSTHQNLCACTLNIKVMKPQISE